jgi:hypothetical protein
VGAIDAGTPIVVMGHGSFALVVEADRGDNRKANG